MAKTTERLRKVAYPKYNVSSLGYDHVVGQHDAKEILSSMVHHNKVPNCLLITGAEGMGGFPLAMAFTRHVLCKQSLPDQSCGECDNCLKVNKYQHPDVHFCYPTVKMAERKQVSLDYIDLWRDAISDHTTYLTNAQWMDKMKAENRQGNIPAEDARDILRRLSLKPMLDGWKVMIIWLPERLGLQSNILLKTLEEPAPDTCIILVSENEEALLPTIKSRSQIVRLKPIDNESLTEALELRLGEDVVAAKLQAVQLADGNFIQALRIAQASEANFTQLFIDWMRACYRPDFPSLYPLFDEFHKLGRESQKQFLDYSNFMIRNAWLAHHDWTELIRVYGREDGFIANFNRFVTDANIQDFSKALSDATFFVERNGNPKLIFLNLSLQIHSYFVKAGKAKA